MMAEALVEAGETHEALTTLDESLEVSRHASDRYYESELYRFKGELLLVEEDRASRTRERSTKQPTSGALAAVEECFSRAIELARSQQAKWFELRASLSLSRLRRRQGKDPRVGEVLLPVYDWFTEGVNTPDLLAAKEFLGSAKR